MIITHKEFPNYKRYEIDYEGRPLVMEVGKLAELCNASVLVTYGETTVLVTCTASARPKDGIDYFPLAVDFNEKLYAVGRIPGSFMRREGKPSLPAVLASRLIDRPMRPLFPSDLRNDVVIACEVLSVDRDCSPEITAMIGASAAVSISDVPFNGPIAGIVLGEYSVKSGWFNSETMLYMSFVTVANYSQASFEMGYALKFMRIILLVMTSLFNGWGFVLGTILVICAIVFNRTIAGKSYIYPLIPFSWSECRKRFFRGRLPHTEKSEQAE